MPSKEISKTFDPKADIPDLSGKVILVTGGRLYSSVTEI
jgi:hypothetical protein